MMRCLSTRPRNYQRRSPEGGVAAAVSFDLWQTVTAITFGVEQADLDLDRLDRLIPRLDVDESPWQVGVADVDAIESTTEVLRRYDRLSPRGDRHCRELE